MDFRTEKISWVMIVIMIATMMYYILAGAGFDSGGKVIFQSFLFGLLTVIALIALMSIPVLIYCYAVKMIPDIDYSIRAAFALTVIGIISELIF